jgi:flagellar biosynthetic protein FliR
MKMDDLLAAGVNYAVTGHATLVHAALAHAVRGQEVRGQTAGDSDALAQWSAMASTLVLILIRVSVVMAIGPLFSSRVFAVRTKIIFALLLTWLVAPVATLQAPTLGVASVMGELAVGGVYALTLAMLSEILLLAGQVAGVQFSFSLVNLLDPSSEIQTPLLADLFQLFGLWILFAAGLDRLLLHSLMRSLRALPPGAFVLHPATIARELTPMLSGAFFAALQLVAPLLAVTVLVDIAVALVGRLAPQLPVISMTIPLKTLLGLAILIGTLALWPRYLEARFDELLSAAEHLLRQAAGG